MADRYYECVECGDCWLEPPRACECGGTDFQAVSAGDLFDADELGLDPETDPERYSHG